MSDTQPPRMFFVFFDDQQGICFPMGWDDDCEGAICSWCEPGKVAVFRTRKDARTAIGISIRWNELLRAQGKVRNEDFDPECRKCLIIVEGKEGA